MSYKPRGLGHINLFVRNAERSQEWYADLLGLTTYGFTPGRAAFMTADPGNSHEIALIELGDDAPGPQRGQVGLNHMAWYMDTLDDLKELYHRIKERDIEIERISDHGHSIGIYIHDPDGNGIEVSYEMPRSEWGNAEGEYVIGGAPKGRLSGPWDAEIAEYARRPPFPLRGRGTSLLTGLIGKSFGGFMGTLGDTSPKPPGLGSPLGRLMTNGFRKPLNKLLDCPRPRLS